MNELEDAAIMIKGSRPTAINLSWGVDRVMRAAALEETAEEIRIAALREAEEIAGEDVRINKLLGRHTTELRSERDDDKVVNTCLLKQPYTLFNITKETEMCGITRKHNARMRIKGDSHSVRPALAGLLHNTRQEHAMTKVNTVKNTHGDNRITEFKPCITVVYFHKLIGNSKIRKIPTLSLLSGQIITVIIQQRLSLYINFTPNDFPKVFDNKR